MKKKIPTAEEFIQQYATWTVQDSPDTMTTVIDKADCLEAMIEYAKLHVKAALKAALESIPCLGSSTDIATYEEVEEEVLNSYPENLIV